MCACPQVCTEEYGEYERLSMSVNVEESARARVCVCEKLAHETTAFVGRVRGVRALPRASERLSPAHPAGILLSAAPPPTAGLGSCRVRVGGARSRAGGTSRGSQGLLRGRGFGAAPPGVPFFSSPPASSFPHSGLGHLSIHFLTHWTFMCPPLRQRTS